VGIKGDNLEYLDYLEVQVPGLLANVWETRLVAVTRETIRFYKLPPGKLKEHCPGRVNLSQSLQQYFRLGGFNNEVMADMDFILDTDIPVIDMQIILHITPNQLGPYFAILITYSNPHATPKEKEKDALNAEIKCFLKADDSVHRNSACDGIYA